MGEYAEQYILDTYGVDIRGDDKPAKPKPLRKFGCKCGRMFLTQEAKEQHVKDKHELKESK